MNDVAMKSRRRFLTRLAAGAGTLLLAGCERLSESSWFPKVLSAGERLSHAAQSLVTGRKAMAQEFSEADLSPTFRSNGTAEPDSEAYAALAAKGFADYRLDVGGLVGAPRSFSLADLRALDSRTQITRHDCVEGWSAIGKWKGAKLSALLDVVKAKPEARYVVFYCADPMSDSDGDGINDSDFYYESLDMVEATHPQTLLAYGLNGQDLDIAHGAPVRVRAERQLGYKQPKYVKDIVLVDSLEKIGGGKGGYWEDQGYNWWGGI